VDGRTGVVAHIFALRQGSRLIADDIRRHLCLVWRLFLLNMAVRGHASHLVFCLVLSEASSHEHFDVFLRNHNRTLIVAQFRPNFGKNVIAEDLTHLYYSLAICRCSVITGMSGGGDIH